jgi:proteasome lid subunit RPN8/RPN11
VDHAPLTTVASYLHRDEAELARVRLGAVGLPAAVRADDEGGLSPGFFTEFRVRVEVRRTDLADALLELGIAAEEVTVAAAVIDAMIAHTVFCAPAEACGLVAVDAEGAIRMVYALTNRDRSPVRYTVDPAEHLGSLRHAERNGWEIAGVFHSHPATRPVPSGRDIAGALDPEWLQLILGPAADPELRGYRIRHGIVPEVALRTA